MEDTESLQGIAVWLKRLGDTAWSTELRESLWVYPIVGRGFPGTLVRRGADGPGHRLLVGRAKSSFLWLRRCTSYN